MEFGSPLKSITQTGIYVGTSAPTLKTYAQWLSSRTGYWAWIDISQEVTGTVAVTIASGDIAVGGTPLTAGFTRYVTAQISSSGMALSASALVASATEEGVISASLSSGDINLMATALTAAYTRYVAGSLSAGNNNLSGTALTSAFKRFITASLSAGDVAVSGTALTATAGGAPTAVSDNFNRANNASLGANWTTITSRAAPAISGNTAAGNGTTDNAAAYWSANTFNANQYSEIAWSLIGVTGNGYGVGPVVRAQSAANTFYFAAYKSYDNGEGGGTDTLTLYKSVAGTITAIGTPYTTSLGAMPAIIRLEVSSTTLTVKTAATHNDNGTTGYTTRITATDSAISDGSAGIHCLGYSGEDAKLDNFYGGDL